MSCNKYKSKGRQYAVECLENEWNSLTTSSTEESEGNLIGLTGARADEQE